MQHKIWLRVGMELTLTDAEWSELNSEKCDPQRILELLQSSRCKICGNSYAPDIEQNGSAAGLEWDLPETPASRFFVETPDGLLTAFRTGDLDYPGVAVDIKSPNAALPDISLSLTEYIPGGEHVSDYDPSHPAEMSRQSAEVPMERQSSGEAGHQRVTPGFVTRSWPNETENQEFHLRTFHYGYKVTEET